jgi:hypothetical protein
VTKRALLAACACALVLTPGAYAHGPGGKGYESTVESLRPAVSGVTVRVLDGDDRLELVNSSGRTILIRGYGGEPYIRFAPSGVFENKNSPAVYLNKDRFARVDLPPTAKATAPPRWEKVADGTSYEWHDHRAHWMSPIAPRPIREDPDSDHHVFDWEVPGRFEGRPFVIAGSLDYSPPDEGGVPTLFLSVLGGALLLTAVALYFLRRRLVRRA